MGQWDVASRPRRQWLMHPAVILFAALGLSVLAWLVPGESLALRGFDTRASPSLGGILLLVIWYAGLGLVVLLAYAVGSATGPIESIRAQDGDDRFDRALLLFVTVVAAIGTLSTFLDAGGLDAFVSAFESSSANDLKEATGQAGLATLRYASGVSAALAVHRVLIKRTGVLLMIVNLVLLLITAAIASRLMLILAVLVLIYLVVMRTERIALRSRTWVLGGLGVLGVWVALTVLNFSRNGNYYAANGVTNPFAANAWEILTYLGAPFQVSLGVAERIYSDNTAFQGTSTPPWRMFVPSFFQGDASGAWSGVDRYENAVDIRDSLTTNSAFADTISNYGLLGLLCVLAMAAVAAFLMGHFRNYSSYIIATAGVLGYGFAEIWRILLFNQGVLIFSALIPVIGTLAIIPFRRRRSAPHRAR